MDKVDLKKELKNLYNPSAKEVSVVDVPAMNFLLVNGEGAPTSPQYSEAIEALFTLSYTLKFMVKKSKGIDYAVMPLEDVVIPTGVNSWRSGFLVIWKTSVDLP